MAFVFDSLLITKMEWKLDNFVSVFHPSITISLDRCKLWLICRLCRCGWYLRRFRLFLMTWSSGLLFGPVRAGSDVCIWLFAPGGIICCVFRRRRIRFAHFFFSWVWHYLKCLDSIKCGTTVYSTITYSITYDSYWTFLFQSFVLPLCGTGTQGYHHPMAVRARALGDKVPIFYFHSHSSSLVHFSQSRFSCMPFMIKYLLPFLHHDVFYAPSYDPFIRIRPPYMYASILKQFKLGCYIIILVWAVNNRDFQFFWSGTSVWHSNTHGCW